MRIMEPMVRVESCGACLNSYTCDTLKQKHFDAWKQKEKYQESSNWLETHAIADNDNVDSERVEPQFSIGNVLWFLGESFFFHDKE